MKKWEAPQLIVLVRSRPEESLISTCKHWQNPNEGPNAFYSACVMGDVSSCNWCVQEAVS